MTRAIFFDIDGTLVSFRTHRIAQSTLDEVKRVREMGVKVFIATGRPRPFVTNLGDFPFDGMICTNGATCMDAEEHVFHHTPIPHEDIVRLVEHQRTHPLPIILANSRDVFIANRYTRNDEVEEVMTMLDIAIPAARPIEDALGMEVTQGVAFIHPDEEESIMQNVLRGCDATRWHPSFVDCIAKGTSKASGIDIVLQHYGIDLSETMAFGDGGNDIEMLQHVAIGVAMGNAKDEVKAVADITTTSVDDDGIARVLRQLVV